MIKLTQFKLTYNQNTIAEIPSFEVKRNEKAVVVGGNGSGKTTLLKSIAGLSQNYSGEFLCKFTDSKITFVHQEPMMFIGNVLDNLVYGLKAHGVGKEESARRLSNWTPKLDIQKLLQRDAQTLSGGEKKKVALIRALITQPELLLIDEPLAELDDAASDELIELIQSLEKTAVIATTPFFDKRFENFCRYDMPATLPASNHVPND